MVQTPGFLTAAGQALRRLMSRSVAVSCRTLPAACNKMWERGRDPGPAVNDALNLGQLLEQSFLLTANSVASSARGVGKAYQILPVLRMVP